MDDITENGKYYIPSIDEFHDGFEYECKIHDTHVFAKTVFKPTNGNLFDVEFTEPNINPTYSVPTCIRVKHLDHEDIIKTGWIVTHKELHEYSFKERYGLSASVNYSLVAIFEKGDGINKTLFNGKIRNISELSLIMSQVGIILP